ncbi:pyrroline-5-carboxylate reductase [Salisediminibacterium selenitireducens]|uniref:Pyrroline-5-carboxylate reductase n=1 Tax=Bacillus selenitireducens (strain ATCC 700615 / DSM 15326 / MLS10) TaxID=439292 RepID=D6XSG4_BACIE|nr:pyrroline-5-carboxylate reductase [Salisediminibacterium selenitireducens]ADH98750.1 pyrroline-5-carboxylate reductase [[Bacillus] selenitireducens MLS10]
MMKNNRTRLFIGAGRMSEAILSGLITSGAEPASIVVSNRRDKEKRHALEERYGIRSTEDAVMAAKQADTIVLCSPPDQVSDVLAKLSPVLRRQLVISVAAGIDVTYMKKRLPDKTPAAWIMPNTGAMIASSISPYTLSEDMGDDERAEVERIVNSIGDGYRTTEEQVHALTAITGSAPAFFYLYYEAMVKCASEAGVSNEDAAFLVRNMMQGSLAMLSEGYDAEALIDQVASPGGSTREGLNVLEDHDLLGLIKQAVKAANDHARANARS